MDILNKAGSYPELAGLRSPSVPKPEHTAPVAQITNRAGQDVPDPREATVSVAPAGDDPMEMSNAVRSLNESVQNIQRGIEFSIDEESGRSVVKIVDRETGSVIRQIPTEDALVVSRHIKEFIESRQQMMDSGGQQQAEALGLIMRVQA